MLSALRAYPRLGDGSNLRGWLFTIARRKAIDAHRARARRPMPVAEPDPGPAVDAQPEMDEGLWQEVRNLPVKQRKAVVLRFAADKSYPEIAAAMSTTQELGTPERARGTEETQKGAAMTVDTSVTERFLERAEAKGLVDVAVTTMDSPVGTLLLMATPKGLVRIAFETENRDEVLGEVATRISPRILEAPRRLDPVRRELDRYFAGRLQDFDVPLDWSLVGDFARRVLRRTARIPYGSVASYGNVALEIGTPRAARAVGNALGSNPIPVVVPCHRVVRSGGAIGGYGGGLQRKRWLLALEAGEPATSREAAPTG